MVENKNIVLHVTASSNSNLSGEVCLKLVRVLRVLEGRREVWIATMTGTSRSVVAKRFLPGSKQGKESHLEIRGLNELKDRGVPGPNLLCVASDNVGGIWVLTDYIEGAADLSEVLVAGAHASSEAAAISGFARTLIMHWRKGVHQTDVHNRNYLWDGKLLYTIDVGSIRFMRGAITRRLRVDTLTRTCFKFSDNQWSLFLDAFDGIAENSDEKALSAFMRSSGFKNQLENRKRKEKKRVWQKSQRTSSDFRVSSEPGLRLFAVSTADAALIEKISSEPDSLFDQGTRLKSGNTCTVQLVEFGGRKYVVKRYNRKPFVYRLRHIFSTSRIVYSWANAAVLQRFRIRTPQVVVACEFRKFGLLDRGFVVMECVQGETLDSFMQQSSFTPENRMAYIDEAADLLENLRIFRIVHGDMKAKNLLVEDGKIWLIDIDGMQLFLGERQFARKFVKDRKRFLRNWDELPNVQAEFEQALSNRCSLLAL
jgi:tRNA A-37 threonylcarbamoyl transferase component Bud32